MEIRIVKVGLLLLTTCTACCTGTTKMSSTLALSVNEEIQSEYYQNTSVSVKGASLEWIDSGGEGHTRYFGHWSDNSKQDATSTTHNMCTELCINGDTTELVQGLLENGTVWKGTNGAAVSYW